jgi:DNA polymerase III epsilon subunit-like protein
LLGFETTDFGECDGIIEVAGVMFGTDFGEVVRGFETLVNPDPSIFPQATLKVHRLQAHDLRAALAFSEVGQ